MPSVFPPIEAGSIAELASALGLDPKALAAAVDEFNRAVRPGTFDPGSLDSCRTDGLDRLKATGAIHRHAALLRLSAAAGHYVYLLRDHGG